MATIRTSFEHFVLGNPVYSGATVTLYTVSAGVRTATKATLYDSPLGTGTLANPQILDSEGKFLQPVYFDTPVIAAVTGAVNIDDHETGVVPDLGSMAYDLMSPGIAAVMSVFASLGAVKRSIVAAATAQVQYVIGSTLTGVGAYAKDARRWATVALGYSNAAHAASALATGLAQSAAARLRQAATLISNFTMLGASAVSSAAAYANLARAQYIKARTQATAAAASAASAASSAGTFDQAQNVFNADVFGH